ncbi:MAG: sugar transferase [Actinomycetaceae bacterium]|nr:sugar transferase [Actinomycetaceae bacterium]MDO5747026.1 sugar transferase [Actinomycetaceae bacterium]
MAPHNKTKTYKKKLASSATTRPPAQQPLVMTRQQHCASAYIRRGFDIFSAGAGLIVLTPLMGVIALAVTLDSRGPALFHQKRIGKDGIPFYICKFRSMRTDHDGLAVSTSADNRVTRVGRVLRKTKLDEIPQLYNVLAGDMSLVGPRPEVPQYARLWPRDAAKVIVSARPGITDPVSIKYRNEADVLAQAEDAEAYYVNVLLPEKAHAYADYIRTRTLASDLRIVIETLKAVVSG